ncbi:MAG: TrbG/VirB9 family P-type conjugative transfer protein [Hyphomonadaceae bacterium]|nr:TrbG/VirB9 family P-type conjugative transfer protein [Hyphomonadaceae bacterium]
MKCAPTATAFAFIAALAACATRPAADHTNTPSQGAAQVVADAPAPRVIPEAMSDPSVTAPSTTAPAPTPRPRRRALTPLATLAEANAEARRTPDPEAFVDAAQIYVYAPGALYEVYAAPGFLSTILLEPGEAIVTVAAGDTTRWMVEEAVAGDAGELRALLLLKPTRAGIRTNIVLVTDRRTYLIEAVAIEGRTYSAQTAWRYGDENVASSASVIGIDALDQLNFRYRIETVRGNAPRWCPVRVFDDGRRTYVEFPLDLATSEAPPLFLADGGDVALVNYRVIGNRYVVDRLFEVAELRLGGARQTIVRISRERPRPVRRRR